MDLITKITRQDTEQRFKMSYEEYSNLEGEGLHGEWVDGEVIIFVAPTTRHQRLILFLGTLLYNFANLHELGEVLMSPVEMRLTNSAREPDILFVAQDSVDRITEKKLQGPADVVVEIISPSSVTRDRVEKFAEYAAEGIREYWLIDARPSHQAAEVYLLAEDGTYQPITPDEQGRFHSRVLPGFWLDRAWLRQDPLPDSLEVLAQIAPGYFTLR